MYEKIDAYVQQLIRESTPDRTVWNIEKIRQGKSASWNYIDGCMMTALLAMTEITGDDQYENFAESCIDYFVREDGSILSYEPDKFNLDDINEGRVLFPLYRKTGKEKYKKAAYTLRQQLREQPRTFEGNFWHKAIYPNQVWLDGLYMAQPFYALFEREFGEGVFSDTLSDPVTGCSKNFWLRSIGWYAVALADLCEILPDGKSKERICELLRELIEGADRYADPDTGIYWQVVDQVGREGNYLETSGSSMLAYAMLKGARLGVLDQKYTAKGQKTFRGIVDKYLSFQDGTLNLGGICLVAGLGPENNRRRDGSYEYYISEPVVENDAKGVAPFLLCYTEIKRLEK